MFEVWLFVGSSSLQIIAQLGGNHIPRTVTNTDFCQWIASLPADTLLIEIRPQTWDGKERGARQDSPIVSSVFRPARTECENA